MTTHRCPHPTCEKQVPRHMLACKAHWFQLPKVIRDAVWSAYRNGDSDAHRDAIQSAIAFWRKHP